MSTLCDTLVFLLSFASDTNSSFQDASIDPSEVFNRVVSSVCILLTKDEVPFN